MAQAKRVHSTPRRTASKIKVKKIAKPASAESEEQRNLRHGKAFRNLETPIHELAADVATGMHEDQDKLAHFAIYRLCDMVRDFRAKYRSELHAGPDRGKAVA
jgi:hypothetical protein